MESINYTPLKIKEKNGSDRINTILLFLITLTALVLAIVLFLLIQRNLRQNSLNQPTQSAVPTLPVTSPQKDSTASSLVDEERLVTPTEIILYTPPSTNPGELDQ